MVVRTVFPKILAADILVTFLSVLTAEPAAFVTQEFHLVLLGFGQCAQFVKDFVQTKVRHNIAEIISVHFLHKLLKIRQHLCGGGYEIEVRVIPFQIRQQQIGMDDDAIPTLRVESVTEAIACFVRKVLLPEPRVAEGQAGGYAVFLAIE